MPDIDGDLARDTTNQRGIISEMQGTCTASNNPKLLYETRTKTRNGMFYSTDTGYPVWKIAPRVQTYVGSCDLSRLSTREVTGHVEQAQK